MRAVVYTRFSPRRDADTSRSCETQEAQCRAHCESQGWEVVSAHSDEAVSGSTWVRPGLEGAIASLEKGSILVAYRYDRIARDLLLALHTSRRVREAGARTVVVAGDPTNGADTPEARLALHIQWVVDQYNREVSALRTQATMLTLQASGRRMGGRAPFGQMADPSDPQRWIDNPSELAAIRRVWELVAEGLSTYRIKQMLDEELPEVCRGKAWSRATIDKIGRPTD